jgi:hypothetical protein
MDYNSIVFREFTHESVERIKRYRQEEVESIASKRLEKQTINDENNNEPIVPKPMPNKELAVGQKLPRVLQNKFPAELIGKPIEEIDCYYRTEYVCIYIIF